MPYKRCKNLVAISYMVQISWGNVRKKWVEKRGNFITTLRSRLVCFASQQARTLRIPEPDRSVSKVVRAKKLVYTLGFSEIDLKDVARVGGKNASLGELFNSLKPKGVSVVDGFATTSWG